MIGRIEVARIEGVNLWRTRVFTNKKDIFQGENRQWSETINVFFKVFFKPGRLFKWARFLYKAIRDKPLLAMKMVREPKFQMSF